MPISAERQRVLNKNNAEVNLETRNCIKAALIDLLKHENYENIRMTDIIRKSGVSRMGVYNNYKSVDEIMLDIYQKPLQEVFFTLGDSVYENLEFVLKATGWKDNAAIDKRIEEVLLSVGMQTKAHKMPHQLSGGEQQRIAIARSLLNSPKVIIADEPTGNLDNETADGIMQLLTGINRENGTAIVMVTHNRAIYEKYPGRIFVCKNEHCHALTD